MMKLTISFGSGSKNCLGPVRFRRCRARRREEKDRAGRPRGNATYRAALRGVWLRLGPYSWVSILRAYLMRNLFAFSGQGIGTGCARTQRGAFSALGLVGEATPNEAAILRFCYLLALSVCGGLARSPWSCGTSPCAGNVRPIRARIAPREDFLPVRADLAIRDCLPHWAEHGGSVTSIQTPLKSQWDTTGNEK